uniref:Otoferlin (Trinotate prediction) n=1 Tax=Henneguya salminicola TaxID=69463 RepID=A0A6G3ME02_HENSL
MFFIDLIHIGAPPLEEEEEVLVPESSDDKEIENTEEKIDSQLEWWLNYYATKNELEEDDKKSVFDETLTYLKFYQIKEQRPVKYFTTELENISYFKRFSDTFQTYYLNKGTENGAVQEDPESLLVAKFKGKMKLWSYPLPAEVKDNPTGTFVAFPPIEPVKFQLRLYIIKANDLHPTDADGKADSYIVVELGNTIIKDNKNYVPKNLNPYYGKSFVLNAEFPRDYLLKIKIFDFDEIGSDELIGETEVDLESRFYSKHLPSTPMPLIYSQCGAWKWRHPIEPSQILQNIVTDYGFDPPTYKNGECQVGNYIFASTSTALDSSGSKIPSNEPAALKAIQNLHLISQIGFPIVPEHIETRQLYNRAKQGISQVWMKSYEMYREV